MSISELERKGDGIINETARLSHRKSEASEISSKASHDASFNTISNIPIYTHPISKEVVMLTMLIVANLLFINMLLMHFDRLVSAYRYLYKKVKKPKFKVGEFVMINDVEYEIMMLSNSSKPYTYVCLPVNINRNRVFESYFHETRIKKKTGLLKELE